MATKTLKSTARKVNGMSAKTAAVRKAMDKNIAKNGAKRAAKAGKAGPAGLAKLFPMNEAARKEAAKTKPTPAGVKPIAQAAAAEARAFLAKLDGPKSGPSPATLGAAAAKADDIKAEIEALRAKGKATSSQAARNKLAKARRALEATLAALPKPTKATKPAKASKQAAAEPKPMTGSKATIADMMRRPNGATEAEVCKKLGWQAAGATISRVIKLLPAGSVTKTKGEDGKTRYIAA